MIKTDSLLLFSLLATGIGVVSAGETQPDVTPVISRPGELIFADDFDKVEIRSEAVNKSLESRL